MRAKRSGRKVTQSTRCRSVSPALLASAAAGIVLLFFAPLAMAQAGFYWIPTISVEQIYDDNLFFSTEDEVSDYITRVSPQLDIGYDSGNLDWLLSYRNDAEWYRDNSELDSTTARGFGSGTIEYQPNRRWVLDGQASYTTTNSLADLSLTPGGEIPGRVGRAEAERLLFGAGARYRFTERFAGRLDAAWADDEIIDISRNETTSADAIFEQALTPARQLQYAYRYRNYDFEDISDPEDENPLTTSQDSSTVWLGWQEELSETSTLDLRAGPRFVDGDVEPYLFLNWRRDYARGSTTVEAAWDETALAGESGRQDSKSIYLGWTHNFSTRMSVTGAAGYADLTRGDIDTELTTFSAAGSYRFTPGISLRARYVYSVQQQDIPAPQAGRIVQNILSVFVIFTRPRPSAERS